ncbi:hypothetical protein QTO34_000726 [Cnephaeus nilssonii]|uniref:L1 transposable element dsRBD-like domain-containing protein n=1 Tax=Cnephaeus nilssonii TaxID=3371016 RepID=A0AA40ICS4_CNENI|nr:hypothetical protein QTO34_000726 [Eptesicus nilssonii]
MPDVQLNPARWALVLSIQASPSHTMAFHKKLSSAPRIRASLPLVSHRRLGQLQPQVLTPGTTGWAASPSPGPQPAVGTDARDCRVDGFSVYQAVASLRHWHLDMGQADVRLLQLAAAWDHGAGGFFVSRAAASLRRWHPDVGQADVRLLQLAAAWDHGAGGFLVSLAAASLRHWRLTSLTPTGPEWLGGGAAAIFVRSRPLRGSHPLRLSTAGETPQRPWIIKSGGASSGLSQRATETRQRMESSDEEDMEKHRIHLRPVALRTRCTSCPVKSGLTGPPLWGAFSPRPSVRVPMDSKGRSLRGEEVEVPPGLLGYMMAQSPPLTSPASPIAPNCPTLLTCLPPTALPSRPSCDDMGSNWQADRGQDNSKHTPHRPPPPHHYRQRPPFAGGNQQANRGTVLAGEWPAPHPIAQPPLLVASLCGRLPAPAPALAARERDKPHTLRSQVPMAVPAPAAWEKDKTHAPRSQAPAAVPVPAARERDKPHALWAQTPVAATQAKPPTHGPLRMRQAQGKLAQVLGVCGRPEGGKLGSRLSFRIEGPLKSFTDKKKLKELITTKPVLHEMLKGILEEEQEEEEEEEDNDDDDKIKTEKHQALPPAQQGLAGDLRLRPTFWWGLTGDLRL